jgi:protein-disulfide isomerase
MSLSRWLPLLGALAGLGAAGCPPKSDPGEKPVASPEVSLAGVDTSSLTPRERREWASQVSELLAPCPETPVSIAQCVKEQRPCKTCLPAAQYLLKQVKAGRAKKDREDAFRMRFDASKVKTLSVDGSPSLGPPDAPVTIVEWADFECPFCRLVYPLLEDVVKRFDGQVRLVYKFYPLGSHPHGEIAARAAVAAMNQGKFWEMHHTLFDNQERLEQADLERYAKELRLDVVKFRKDLTSDETSARIEKDKQQAEGVGLEGTPMIFINGREVDLTHLANPTNPAEDLEDWVKLDIEIAGQTPKAAPPPSQVAAPSSSAAAPTAPASGSPAPGKPAP